MFDGRVRTASELRRATRLGEALRSDGFHEESTALHGCPSRAGESGPAADGVDAVECSHAVPAWRSATAVGRARKWTAVIRRRSGFERVLATESRRVGSRGKLVNGARSRIQTSCRRADRNGARDARQHTDDGDSPYQRTRSPSPAGRFCPDECSHLLILAVSVENSL
jgi:hypothetical protein